GIYSLEGNTLKICCVSPYSGGKERPTELATKPGSGHLLLVFKRQPFFHQPFQSPDGKPVWVDFREAQTIPFDPQRDKLPWSFPGARFWPYTIKFDPQQVMADGKKRIEAATKKLLESKTLLEYQEALEALDQAVKQSGVLSGFPPPPEKKP